MIRCRFGPRFFLEIGVGTAGAPRFAGAWHETAGLVRSPNVSRSPGRAHPAYAPTIRGTLLTGAPYINIFFGALPASGSLFANVGVPIHPSAQSFALIEQAVYFTQAKGFQVSNPRLGIVLDQSLCRSATLMLGMPAARPKYRVS